MNNTLKLSRNIFVNNSAEYGGTLHAESNNNLAISENTFLNNTGNYGGALFADTNNTLTLSENRFWNNSANSAIAGAICAYVNNTLTLSDCTFHGNSATTTGGALYANVGNTFSISDSTFLINSANYGGAIFAYENNTFNLSNNTFQNNSAATCGAALDAGRGNKLSILDNKFLTNSADYGGAVCAYANNILTLSENILQSNSAGTGGALSTDTNNTLTISNNTFQNNSASYYGGAFDVHEDNTLTVSENTFQNNLADYGGAISAQVNNNITVSDNTFQRSSAGHVGGAIYIYKYNDLTVIDAKIQNNTAGYGAALYAFTNNMLTLSDSILQTNSADFGGAVFADSNNTLIFLRNVIHNSSARYDGGVLYAREHNTLTLSENTVGSNSAFIGGALYLRRHNFFTLSENTFQCNSADYSGGVLYTANNNTFTLSRNTFQNNTADYDGGALIVHQSTVNLTSNNLTGNTAQSKGGALLCLSNSITTVYGSHRIQNNRAQYGGGVAALECQIMLVGDLTLENNEAYSGGGLYLLTDDSKLYFHPNTNTKFTNNHANQTGGAIKVEANNPLSNCVESYCQLLLGRDCFYQFQTQREYDINTNISEITELHNIRIYFTNNTALEGGATLYGGSVDSCSLSFTNVHQDGFQLSTCPISGKVFDYITRFNKHFLDISSNPLYICTCKNGKPNCSTSSPTVSVYPGSKAAISITAYGQRNGSTPAVIRSSITRGDMTIDDLENTWRISSGCTVLNYTVRTFEVGTTQEMTVYIEGPCPPNEGVFPTNFIRILVSVLQCPPGFQLLVQAACVCAQRLQPFTNTCSIDDQTVEHTGGFWVGYIHDNISEGLILHPHCPFDYCIPTSRFILVTESDAQCNSNRAGLLCGKCDQNFSLVLGTNHCLHCSDNFWLLAAFSFAGVILITFLFVLRLTVAVGTTNGLLLYANIFIMNSATFIPHQQTNVLTVFIAWLNLDLGIEVCFFNGMDMYTKAWLQFVFPLYIWILLIAVIIISHYSMRVSKLLSSSTIEVFATLILLSYAKLLRTVIVALSYTYLEYPNNSLAAVWLYDANIRYLSNKHVPLFVAAVLCLFFLFFPYTMFLIFGQCFRAKSGWRICSWVNHYRILPFLEAYHAPYAEKHRYWTGLMLIFRCILFLIFAFNVLGDPNINLLCIACGTALLQILYVLLGKRIYRAWPLTILELSFISNLCILAIATLYTRNNGAAADVQNAVTFTSIATAFAIFIGIIIYHFVQKIKEIIQRCKRVFPSKGGRYDPFSSNEAEGIHQSSQHNPTVSHLDIWELILSQEKSMKLKESHSYMKTNS